MAHEDFAHSAASWTHGIPKSIFKDLSSTHAKSTPLGQNSGAGSEPVVQQHCRLFG